ncbi:dicarboxylate/amino acid:cation symporter [Eisenibacter elegans]|jgi:Na+/H+-dicarboxylate symporter|uniref:dicarboxylate/amino acid:cation symporter n=1 Tax=Eisenibacter elegans TaxID=997 RepID=UPI00040C4624|nr:dicarboxylate/amino acid:cation symporter [Eisenibacter elegans]
MRKLPLHFQILIGLLLGVVAGLALVYWQVDAKFTLYYIKPFGTIFVNLLKMIAVPLVLASLVVGVSSLNDVAKLSRIGGKTILIYMCTTAIATSLGLLMANMIEPGKRLPDSTREKLIGTYASNSSQSIETAQKLQNRSPLQPLVDMVPENLFAAAANNASMLQIVFFATLLGIALIGIAPEKRQAVVSFFEGLNDAIIRIVEFIMAAAPIGVFALMAALIVEISGDNPAEAVSILTALLWYSFAVLLGLTLMIVVVYATMVRFMTRVSVVNFLAAIRPAQILGFSTSSSSATLPVTMECCQKDLNVSEEVSSFVLPLGATINMDGTALYQSVAAVFIAQALGMELSITQQLMIVMTATLASIGSAGVPGAGMVMLVIVLEAIQVPPEGIALIVGVDRLLDMCRTIANVTGDAAVCLIVSEGERSKAAAEAKQELV